MNIFKLTGTALLLSSAFIITGCGSDGSSASKAAVPKDAIVLTEANTETVIAKAFDATDIILAKGSSTTATVAVTSVVDQIVDRARNNAINSGVDLVSGIAFSDTYNCTTYASATEGDPNTTTDKGNYSVSGTTYTASGTATMVSCLDSFTGVTLDGKVSFTFKEDDATGEWSSNVTGNLTMTALSVPIEITNFAMNESGSWVTDDYVISKMQYTYNPGTGGFAVNMTTNIEGNDFACQPTAGVVEISGADKTKARVTFSPTGVLVEVDPGDGTFVEVTTTFFACT